MFRPLKQSHSHPQGPDDEQTLGAPKLVVAARTGMEDYKSLCATRLFHDARQMWLQSIWGENRKLTRLCPREPSDRMGTAPWGTETASSYRSRGI